MRLLSVLLFCSLLTACLGPIDTGPGLVRTSQGFSESMRWQDYQGASRYLMPDVRDDFLKQFEKDEDLRIVGSEILNIDLHADEKWAQTEYALEYYRLPSTRIKKWYWTQRWQLIQEKMTKPGLWLVENAPPPLPWNQ